VRTYTAKRVLLYRLGSLGDTVIALPCFHLIARIFPDAERRLLANIPVNSKAPAAALILGESGLVHSYMSYPVGMRDLRSLRRLSAQIREWKPDLLVYLAASRGIGRTLRDVCFFRASGVKRVVGLSWSRYRRIAQDGAYESEASRLVRSVSEIGDARPDDPESWDLRLSTSERMRARERMRDWPGRNNFVALSLGTKVEVNDWGVGNWRRLLARLGKRYPGLGLLLIGVTEERGLSNNAAAEWRGPVLNLCGVTSPRETAALLGSARLFLGHDSGPMHLAAAVGTCCVAVFSARNLPGVWFPFGADHRVIYHDVPCKGCGLETCMKFEKRCITSVSIDEIFSTVVEAFDRREKAESTGDMVSKRGTTEYYAFRKGSYGS
jgi:heptosyltransferase-3